MKIIILLSGKSQSGKNTFANFITNEFINFGYKVKQDNFAFGVKQGCYEDFQILANYLNNYVEKVKSQIGSICEYNKTINHNFYQNIEKILDEIKITSKDNWFENKTDLTRIILQIYGTQIFRLRVDYNWWANQLKNRLIDSTNNADINIVTDCRFPNEIEVFNDLPEEWKVITIRLERKICNSYNHESETSLDNWESWNYIVDNNGSLDELKEKSKLVSNDILKETFKKHEVFCKKSYLFINDDGFKVIC